MLNGNVPMIVLGITRFLKNGVFEFMASLNSKLDEEAERRVISKEPLPSIHHEFTPILGGKRAKSVR